MLALCVTINLNAQLKEKEIITREKIAQSLTIPDSLIVKDSTYYFMEAIRYFNLKDFKEAKKNLLKAIEANPKNDAAYYYLAQIAINDNDYIAGESYIKNAITRDSSNYWYRSILGNLYGFSKRENDAIEIFENLLKQYPKKSDIYYSLVNLYINANQLDKANSTLDKIIEISGKTDAIGLAKFDIFRMKSDWEGALKYLVNYDNGLNSYRIENLIGDLYSDRYKDSLAMTYYNKSLYNNHNNPGALLGIAEIYRNSGDFENFFKYATPLFADPATNSELKDKYLKQLMQFPQMILANRTAMDSIVTVYANINPKDTAANYSAAVYFAKVGVPDKCIELMQRNYNFYPYNDQFALDYLSYIYSTEDWKLLGEESVKVENRFKEKIFPVQLRAISLYQQKNYPEAIKALDRLKDLAIKLKDTTSLVTAYSLLGDAYHELKLSSKTFSYFKKALAISPNDLTILNNYAYYLATEGKNLKKAYQMSAVTVAKDPDNPTCLDTFGWILYLMDKPVEAKAHFKHAMLYGGKESATILDHYAEVLYKLGEYDLAFIYWDQAKGMKDAEGIEEKIKLRKGQLQK